MSIEAPIVRTCRRCEQVFTIDAGAQATHRRIEQQVGARFAWPSLCDRCEAARPSPRDRLVDWLTCFRCRTLFVATPADLAHLAEDPEIRPRCLLCRGERRRTGT